ncbi:hypothetical protein RRG08_067383 [Elysia crispata]|uniref:Deoxyribodipyrimidine photo-lyase n=1 Tax=Elysia crispata TaxID=231223 RepID=A0AAE0Y9I2_9GAST|nr:hypothetical protein RRG08_067383 [Elysia crispata]
MESQDHPCSSLRSEWSPRIPLLFTEVRMESQDHDDQPSDRYRAGRVRQTSHSFHPLRPVRSKDVLSYPGVAIVTNSVRYCSTVFSQRSPPTITSISTMGEDNPASLENKTSGGNTSKKETEVKDEKTSEPKENEKSNAKDKGQKSKPEPRERPVRKVEKRKLEKSSEDETAAKRSKAEDENNTDEPAEDLGKTDNEDFIKKINQRRTDVCEDVSKFKFNKKRVRVISEEEDFSEDSNGVVYWMSRDQRVQDNWAFLYAQRLAMKLEIPLHVCFCLVPKYLDATIRMYGFMMKGLAQVEKECRELNIPFHLLYGQASKSIPAFVKEHNIGGVVTDFSPLRVPVKWVDDLKNALPSDVPLCQVDAHNLVPCWEASPKLEYGARTIRNKIHNQLGGFLTEFPPLVKHPHPPKTMPKLTDWKKADMTLEVDRTVPEVTWAKPGSQAAYKILQSFCEKRLKHFATQRNDPNKQALSNLSPWIHFGQISVQRCILTVRLYRSKSSDSVNAFIEEAVIRRELADNFCYYNKHYDSIKGAYDWAKKSLALHKDDKRPYLYTRDQLEESKTHDDLWNAAQDQLVLEGKMHGFLRMYWAKKILEWTNSPEEALAFSIYLNDRFSLDGRDPNGYVGCMWSICGIHDQGWAERAVFGKIRYMNYQGCKRKFDVPGFVLSSSEHSKIFIVRFNFQEDPPATQQLLSAYNFQHVTGYLLLKTHFQRYQI